MNTAFFNKKLSTIFSPTKTTYWSIVLIYIILIWKAKAQIIVKAPEHRNEDIEQHDVGKQKVDAHHGESHQPAVFDRTPG